MKIFPLYFLFLSFPLKFSSIRFFNHLGNGIYTAGGRSGNDKHYIQHHERASKPLGVFQKKVNLSDFSDAEVGKLQTV